MKITVKRMEQIIEEEVDKFLLENGQDALDEGILDRLFGLSGQAKRAGKKAGKVKSKEMMRKERETILAQISAKEEEALQAEPSRRNELAREIDQLKASLKGTAGKLRKRAARGAGAAEAERAASSTFQAKFKSKWQTRVKHLRDQFTADFEDHKEQLGDADWKSMWADLNGDSKISLDPKAEEEASGEGSPLKSKPSKGKVKPSPGPAKE